ncbi:MULTISPECIES: tRNA (N6-threonylcarbamoyladenosine(37)-N6)-methyltransferase TrmO [unclassified Halomonas]|uniref:tRNA (N6-threonylcarbamoyladenosine(37)-N6)-methyltransferase TrmO n=1 Tax=unclassified Halomonas TaxID=2609666 RepID=UPI0028836284|nr:MULTISPECIES: tRNA (N6-threonylcarbamoyladenosine(37)-N6)-methyltransferase TrmO [unclassified Halomonas]MDT0501835.1 tRNA (N6-threonylcarbamoyladenosine(37)-N6)-methyltransferase TrmO [Halomonas sp. PAR7]MDT0511861.1 tRNA (N6-threonylcarbamoyladenosine(37)-N6)-methyltransferase TrmO [Halomonas sp. LES1]MDT0592951.1 tRNA (N6-threonylcarbamoyladenosine(37)-N6)-methyltransferase TrmO [Halomonas sp. PAR8]
MSVHSSPPAITLSPIGLIESDFPDKFGVPRQPGLAPSARALLRLLPPYDDPLTVRGLETFSHLWLTFLFHQSPERWTPLVRPPRLGGNRRVGVFASRSTHRPNRLGLSLVELIEVDTRAGVRLRLAGADLVNGTPVLDIKPYLPWAEARPEASAGFAPEAPPRLPVCFTQAAEATLVGRDDAASLRSLIEEVLSQDPRPAYRDDDETRRYGVRLRELDIRFRVVAASRGTRLLEVLEIVPA